MATQVDLTLHQSNNETIAITITTANAGADLSGIDGLEVVIKPDACTADNDEHTLMLTTASAEEVVILSETTSQVTAEAYVPGTYLDEPYDRVWRVDAIGSTGERRTALYGSVTVLDT